MSDVDHLLRAIHAVAAGGSVIDPKVVGVPVDAPARATRSPLARLTPRETEILGDMAQGKNNAAIAAALVLSERAVEKHINSIFSKLNLRGARHPSAGKAMLLFRSDRGGSSSFP